MLAIVRDTIYTRTTRSRCYALPHRWARVAQWIGRAQRPKPRCSAPFSRSLKIEHGHSVYSVQDILLLQGSEQLAPDKLQRTPAAMVILAFIRGQSGHPRSGNLSILENLSMESVMSFWLYDNRTQRVSAVLILVLGLVAACLCSGLSVPTRLYSH